MNKTKFMQTDSRWGGLGYPKKPYYLRNCGCGEVSIANCIIEMSKYASYTPATIQPYCKQYADPKGNGTYWSGIPAMMKHYGMTEVKEHATMDKLWKELAKGNRVAIYLMGSRKGGSKKVHWTSGGHFVCSVDYKVQTGKHYVYVKDSYSNSGSRNGWISYEENMRGDVVKVWSGKIAKTAPTTYRPTTPYKGTLPKTNVTNGSRGADAKACMQFLNWCVKAGVGDDGIAGPKTEKAIRVFQATYGLDEDGIFGPACRKKAQAIIDEHKQPPSLKPYAGEYPNTTVKVSKSKASILAEKANEFAYSTDTSKAKYKGGAPTAAYKAGLNKAYPIRPWSAKAKAGASCDVFVGTCVRCAGIDSKYPRGLSESYTKKCGYFTKVSKSDVKTGDIIFLSSHVCIVYGSKIKEASNGDNAFYPKTTNTQKSRISKSTGIYRAIGSVTTTRSYLQMGDNGEEAKKLQKYLIWYGALPKSETADGLWGPKTDAAVKKMQTDFFGAKEADGKVGPKTIEAMKKVVR